MMTKNRIVLARAKKGTRGEDKEDDRWYTNGRETENKTNEKMAEQVWKSEHCGIWLRREERERS